MSDSDKAGREYWDRAWKGESAKLPHPVDPLQPGIRNYYRRTMHRFFERWFEHLGLSGARLLELGCGNSVWLPYLSKQFGVDVAGVDYSETGCNLERLILAQVGIEADVVQADFFDPPERMRGAFDIAVSFGVVEHFEDTAECLSAFARCLKMDGIIITQVPNMCGAAGMLQKLLDRAVYDVHVPLDREQLAQAHRSAGFEVIDSGYFMSVGLNAINLDGVPNNSIVAIAKRVMVRVLQAMAAVVWAMEERWNGSWPTSKLLSPFVYCIARKTTSGENK